MGTGWRWFYYTGVFIWGVKCLWSKKWLWTIKDCWYNYPYHYVESDVWWWYMAELSFYWGLLITQFFDVKRKDFGMMFIHHAVTIFLMSFSWTCNFYKVGTLVLITHDVADIFLESAKLFKYGGAQKNFRGTFCQLCCIMVRHPTGHLSHLDYLFRHCGSTATDTIFPRLFCLQCLAQCTPPAQHCVGLFNLQGSLQFPDGQRDHCQ